MRIVIGEDQVLLREGVVRLLDEEGHEVVGSAGDGTATQASVLQVATFRGDQEAGPERAAALVDLARTEHVARVHVGALGDDEVSGVHQASDSMMSGTACSTVSITLVSYSTHSV